MTLDDQRPFHPGPPTGTLEYQSRMSAKPSRTGLVAFGVITLVIGGLFTLGGFCFGLSLLTFPMASMTAPASPTTLSVIASSPPNSATVTSPTTTATTAHVVVTPTGVTTYTPFSNGATIRSVMLMAALVGGVMCVGGGTLTLIFGIAILRSRRWVRPWIVAISGAAWISVASSLPNTLIILLANPVALSSGTPNWAVSFGLIVGGISLLVQMGIPLAYFIFFARPATEATLVAYSPHPTWTDRWPLGVFCVMVVTGLWAALVLLGMALWPLLPMAVSTGRGALLVSTALQAMAFATVAVLCYRRSRWALTATWAALLLQALGILLTYITGTRFEVQGLPANMGGGSAAQTTPAALLMPIAFMIAAWCCRKHFAAMTTQPPLAIPA